MEPDRIRLDLTTAKATEFIDRLVGDTGFRDRLQTAPADVLWEYGIELPPSMLSGPIELPSESDINAMRESIADSEFMTIRAGAGLLFPIFWAIFPWPGLSTSGPEE